MSKSQKDFRTVVTSEIIEANTNGLNREFERKRDTLTSLIGLLPQTAKNSLNPLFKQWSQHVHTSDANEASQAEIALFAQLRHELNNATMCGSLPRRDFMKIAGLLMTSGLASLIFPQASQAMTPFAFWKKRASAAGVGTYPTDTGDDPYWDYVVLLMNMDTPTPSTGFTTVFADESNVGKTPTITGSPYIDTTASTSSPYSGRTGSAKFNGTSENICFPDSTDLRMGSNPFTIEGWFKISSLPASGHLYWIIGFDVGNTDFRFGIEQNGYFYYRDRNTGVDITSSTAATTGTFHHFAVCREGTSANQLKIYLDGLLVATGTAAGTYSNTGSKYIGAPLGSNVSDLFSGNLADLRIYKGIAKYTANFTPRTTPIGLGTANDKYWGYCVLACPFENSLKDMSGARCLPYGNAQLSTTSKKFGSSGLNSDQSSGSNYVSVAGNPGFNFGTGDFTIEGWIFLTATGSDNFGTLISHSDYYGTANGNWAFRICPTSIQFVSYNGQSSNEDINLSYSTALNTWYHIAAVRTGTTLSIYVNGTSIGSGAVTKALGDSSSSLKVGAVTNGSYRVCYIDSLRITKGFARYTSNFTPPTASFPVGKDETVDPFWSYTVLAMHMDDFTDTTGRHTFTNNSASINTSTYRFGVGSMYFNGSTWISRTYHSDFDFQGTDFTISAWVLGNCKIALRQSSGSYCPYIIHFNGNSVGGYFSNNGSSWQIAGSWSGGGSSTNWTHHAVSYHKGTLYFFLNGILVHSYVIGSLMAGSQPLWIGRDIDQGYATGYIDDLRITKGVARYIQNFTPPTREFADRLNIAARFWRLLHSGTAYYGGSGTVSYNEIEMFSSIDGTGTDLTAAKTYFASTSFSASYTPDKAFDDNLSSRWATASSAQIGSWIAVDFGSAVAIRSLKLTPAWEGWADTTSIVEVQFSTDGSTWSTIKTINPSNTNGTQTFTSLY